jgi:CheY-like chemotaxis protein
VSRSPTSTGKCAQKCRVSWGKSTLTYAATVTTALVVEDDSDLLALLGKHLERLGCATTLAKTGKAGLEAIAHACPDLAVIDILLPDMNGLEIVAVLRSAEAVRCRIVTTSVLDPDDFRAGSDAVLAKPFSRRDVDRVLLPLLEELRPTSS